MEAGRVRNRDDNPGLPTLSLGLSSVRHIVTKLEAQYARVVTTDVFKSEIVKYKPSTEDKNDYYYYPFDSKAQVLNRFVVNLGVAFSKCIPSVTLANFGFLAVTSGLVAPRMISYLVVYPFCRLVFGTLYPAYASYKAVRTKNLKEYVKWMMYWIVFALFTCTETFTDVFLSWFPFYYEVKIVLVLWLLSPATKGSSILYRKFVHPALCRREQEIDEYIAKAKDQGYHTVLNLGTKGVNYATTVIMQTAIKGGGGLVQQLRKSYSLSDLTECEPREERGADEADDVLAEPRLIRRAVKSGYATRRSASESNRSTMYFPEVDVDVRPRPSRVDEPDFSHIKSTEDISSGYSSAENSASLTRTASVGGSRSRVRSSRTTVTTIKRPQAAEDNHVIIEELHDDDSLDYNNMPPLINYTSPLYLSHTDPPFLYQYVGNQVKIIQMISSYPLSNNNNSDTDNSDKRDQKDTSMENLPPSFNREHISSNRESVVHSSKEDILVDKDSHKDIPVELNIENKDNNSDEPNFKPVVESLQSGNISESKLVNNPIYNETEKCSITPIVTDNTSVDLNTVLNFEMSSIEYDSADSDDEASFETPVSTPKNSRKNVKGKYGKVKAPMPPTVSIVKDQESKLDLNVQDLGTENNAFNVTNASHDNEPNLETKTEVDNVTFEVDNNNELEITKQHKSKSPTRHSKNSALGKILQLPSKLAFWHKSDDKTLNDTNSETSRRSSANTADEFQSCTDLNIYKSQIDNESLPKDEGEESVTKDVFEKSDALQKAIEAKLENHPEYKFVSLHEDVPTTSKSTDV